MLRDAEFGFLVDDAIIFKVEITSYGDLEEASSNCKSTDLLLSGLSPQFSNLPAAIKALYNDETTSDLTMYLGGKNEVFHSHRCILAARSEVFQIMFASHMKETCKGELTIPDYDSNVTKVLLTYLYTDEMPDKTFMNDFAPALMSIAVKYQILGIISFCEEHFLNCLQIENAISVLKFADSVGAIGLKVKSMQFIAQHSNKIMQGKEYQDLDEDLQKEMNMMIDVVSKRRGCRGMIEKDRKSSMNCVIM
jgi:speckle-type POZ protein